MSRWREEFNNKKEAALTTIASEKIQQYALEMQIAALARMVPDKYMNLTQDSLSVADARDFALDLASWLFQTLNDAKSRKYATVSNPSAYQMAYNRSIELESRYFRTLLTLQVETISEIWHKALKQQESLDNPSESDAASAGTTDSSRGPDQADNDASGGALNPESGGASPAEATASPAVQDEDGSPSLSHVDDAASAELGTPCQDS